MTRRQIAQIAKVIREADMAPAARQSLAKAIGETIATTSPRYTLNGNRRFDATQFILDATKEPEH